MSNPILKLIKGASEAKAATKSKVAPIQYAKAAAKHLEGFVQQAPSGEWRIDVYRMLASSGVDPHHLNDAGRKLYADLLGMLDAGYATKEQALGDLAMVSLQNGVHGSTADAIIGKLAQKIDKIPPKQRPLVAAAGAGLGASSYYVGSRMMAPADTAEPERKDPGVPAGWIPPSRANTLPPKYDYSVDDIYADED